MKLTTLASLIASAMICTAAQAAPEVLAGKVASVTVNLSVSYEEGGYKDSDGDPTFEKVSLDTATDYKASYKSNIKKAKYSNKELIYDLIARYDLADTKVSNYKLEYVESDSDYDFGGLFLTNTKTGAIIYIGDLGYTNASNTAFYVDDFGAEVENGTYNVSRKYDGDTTVSESYDGKYNGIDVVYSVLQPRAGVYVYLTGLNNYNGSYKSSYVYGQNASSSYTYSAAASSFTNLVGDGYSDEDDSDFIATGSISLSALKDKSDVIAYYQAYIAANPEVINEL